MKATLRAGLGAPDFLRTTDPPKQLDSVNGLGDEVVTRKISKYPASARG
jgi:hypothetical protein